MPEEDGGEIECGGSCNEAALPQSVAMSAGTCESRTGSHIRRVVWVIGPDEDDADTGWCEDVNQEDFDRRLLMVPDYGTGWGIEPVGHSVYRTQPPTHRKYKTPVSIFIAEQPKAVLLRPRNTPPIDEATALAVRLPTKDKTERDVRAWSSSCSQIYTKCMNPLSKK